jgi:hypothetical protein
MVVPIVEGLTGDLWVDLTAPFAGVAIGSFLYRWIAARSDS